MVYILVITDEIEKWIENFKRNCYFDEKVRGMIRKSGNEIHMRNELFNIEIRKTINEHCRGKAPSVIIIDKPISYRVEREILLPLLGHNGSLKRTENYAIIRD